MKVVSKVVDVFGLFRVEVDYHHSLFKIKLKGLTYLLRRLIKWFVFVEYVNLKELYANNKYTHRITIRLFSALDFYISF